MAGRYTDWSHVHVPGGDREAAAPYVPFARKLLGYVAAQRARGQARTQSVTKTLNDGTVVSAGFNGEVPIMSITPAPRPAPPGRDTVLAGLVALPRTLASTTAFGPFAETLLAPRSLRSATEHWASYFYDASYVPETGGGIYSKTPQGKPLFADGLKFGGNLDWRSQDQSLTVSWCGPASRYFPEGEAFQPWVFFNGDVLFDTTELPQFDTNGATLVLSAAIRKPGTLLVCTYERAFTGGGNHHYIRVYRAALRPSATADRWFKATGLPVWQAPRLDKVAAAGMRVLGDPDITAATPCVRIAETEVTELAGYLYVTPFHFNQSATEARAILPLYQDLTGANAASDMTEFVIDLTDLEAATIARVSHGVVSHDTTTTSVYSEVCNDLFFVGEFEWNEAAPGWPGGTGADGSYPYADPARYIPTGAYYTTNSAVRCTGYPLTATVTKVESCSLAEYPIAVDFIDDVPVYAYLLPASLTTSTSRTGAVTADCTPAGSATDTVSGSGTSCTTTYSATLDQAAAAEGSATSSMSGDRPGLRCIDAAGNDWLNVRGSSAGSGTWSASSSGTQSGAQDGTFTTVIDPGSDLNNHLEITHHLALTGSLDLTEAVDTSKTDSYIKLWYLDLRYQAAAYSRYTHTEAVSLTSALAALALPPATLPVARPTTGSTAIDRALSTYVLFNGVQVDTWTCTLPQAVTATAQNTDIYPDVLSDVGGLAALHPTLNSGFLLPVPFVSTAGFPADSAYAADQAFLATVPNPASPGSPTLPDIAAYPTVVRATTDVADDGWGFWLELSPSLETELGQSWFINVTTAYTGRFQAYRGGWCYSMPKIAGSDVSVHAWQTQISSGESVDTLTGGHGFDLVGELWPLSRCPFLTAKA